MIEKQAEEFWEKCAKYVRNEPKEKRFIKGTTTNWNKEVIINEWKTELS